MSVRPKSRIELCRDMLRAHELLRATGVRDHHHATTIDMQVDPALHHYVLRPAIVTAFGPHKRGLGGTPITTRWASTVTCSIACIALDEPGTGAVACERHG